ncbi:MAG: hypothetical protein ABIH63_02450 [archaeon]
MTLEEELIRMQDSGRIRGSIAQEMAQETVRQRKVIPIKYKLSSQNRRRINYEPREIIKMNYEAMGKIKPRTKIDRVWKETKYTIGTAGMYAGMGALQILVWVLGLIEKQSLNYLNKTRPEVANMMRRKEPFHKVAQEYFRKASP